MRTHFWIALYLCAAIGGALVQAPAAPLQDRGGNEQSRGAERGAWGSGVGLGRGVMGTVTETAGDHYTIRTDSGETYVIHYSVNTRMMKGGGPRRRDGGRSNREDSPPSPPQILKPGEIGVGDVIAANGEIDAAQKSVGAVFIVKLDAERAQQMRAMAANFGKTWLMGRVTAIHEVTVTLQGGPGDQLHTFTADENTTFRRRREPITLGDIQAGEVVRVEGTIKGGTFMATSVVVMGRPQEGPGGTAAGPPPG